MSEGRPKDREQPSSLVILLSVLALAAMGGLVEGRLLGLAIFVTALAGVLVYLMILQALFPDGHRDGGE